MEKPALTQVAAGGKPLTTFVQTDTNSFREVVQRLTGPSEPNNGAQAQQDVSTKGNNYKIMGLKRPKLHERRQHMRPKLEIMKPNFHFRPASSPTDQPGPSPLLSPQGTPSTIMSKLNVGEEKKNEKSEGVLNSKEEEKAIKERRFYLHPSPRGRPGYSEPELLTLFPLTSPGSTEKVNTLPLDK
ncbi:hypothetical protein TIFTF001_002776 [Ficus carica]|uniref:VQ domain-containing protein n=1 Tax=Ficus carica TaxID=3494 RepID=A0AA87ZDA3_FICCA|nr:hypothetical protein TIFTF001_002776 [Ficus carica]